MDSTSYFCDGVDGSDGYTSLIVVDSDFSQAKTETIQAHVKLNINSTYGPPFDINAPSTSSNYRVDLNLYDSNQSEHPAQLYFRLASMYGWEWYVVVDGSSQQGGTAGTPVIVAAGTLSFSASGQLIDVVRTLNDFNPVGAIQPQTFAFDFGDMLTAGGTGELGTILHEAESTLLSASPQRACPAAGSRIRTGIDNGDGGGVAYNQNLEAGEVDSTIYVCDGEDAN